MLDLKFIKENQNVVRQAIRQKNVSLDLDKLLNCERVVFDLKQKVETLQAERNMNAKKVSQTKNEDKKNLIFHGKAIATQLSTLKVSLSEAEQKLTSYLLLVPNIPSKDTPIGPNETYNIEVRRWGTPRKFNFPYLNHIDILENHGWAELQRIAKVSGSRTYALKNELVLLEMALIQFALKQALLHQFQLLTLPSLVREYALLGTGHFPSGKDQVYSLVADDLYLAGTSEVVINSLYSGEILDEKSLPILCAGLSPCFRREAGSAGRDVRGLFRVHQFYKIELFVFCKNDKDESRFWLNRLLSISEEILQKLEIPYRVIEPCTGDMGLGKFRMYDLESWVPSESKYRETHSCSSFHDWQARRSNVRYRTADGHVQFCHTLNNTAIATPRILVPFLENHQQNDGSIYVPSNLRPFLSGIEYLSSNLKNE